MRNDNGETGKNADKAMTEMCAVSDGIQYQKKKCGVHYRARYKKKKTKESVKGMYNTTSWLCNAKKKKKANSPQLTT